MKTHLQATSLALVASLVVLGGIAHAQTPVDSFNPGATSVVRTVAVQPDGKIVVGGQFDLLGGGTGTTFRRFIGRLNADGSLDAGFDPGANGFVYALLIQPDGKILLGGDFTMLGGGGSGDTPRNHIGRLNADGSLDTTFNPGADFRVVRFALQPDGKILVSGAFTMLGGGGTGTVARNSIGRLNADGTLDPAFNPIFNGYVLGLLVQPDGKLVVGGEFSLFGGVGATTVRNQIARLNPDGSLDPGFNPGCNEQIVTMALQPDGKILAGGDFTACGGGHDAFTRNHIVRINPDGSIDPMFSPSLNRIVRSIVLQADGRILVGGEFSGFRNALLRLNANGDVDLGFNPGADHDVIALAPQANGMVIVAGEFTMLGGGGTGTTPRRNIGRVMVAAAATPAMIQNGAFTNGMSGWQVYEPPDIVSSVVNGVFQYYKVNPTSTQSGQAVVYQETGQPMAAGAPLMAQFDLGNSSTERKRVSVLLVDSNFSDLSVCTFWLAPSTPLRTYMMRTHSTKAWANAAIYFYAATGGQDGGAYLIDNVLLEYAAAQAGDRTDCVDPTRPVAAAGASSPNLIVNGDFSAATIGPWGLWGDITQQVSGGVFEFVRPGTPGLPAGVVLQPTGEAMAAKQIVTASFDLGNSSSVRKRVTVLLHDLDFSDLSACTFWLAPGQALGTYTMRSFATRPWANATVSVYAATIGTERWMRLDNVTLQRTPGATISGTECIEAAIGPAPFESQASVPRDPVPGFARTAVTDSQGEPSRRAEGPTTGRAVISFQSPASSRASSVEVQVSRDGETWETLATMPGSDTWTLLDVDLPDWLGEAGFIRLVFTAVPSAPGMEPEVWQIGVVGRTEIRSAL